MVTYGVIRHVYVSRLYHTYTLVGITIHCVAIDRSVSNIFQTDTVAVSDKASAVVAAVPDRAVINHKWNSRVLNSNSAACTVRYRPVFYVVGTAVLSGKTFSHKVIKVAVAPDSNDIPDLIVLCACIVVLIGFISHIIITVCNHGEVVTTFSRVHIRETYGCAVIRCQ